MERQRIKAGPDHARAFSLLEVVIVVAIVAMLSAIAIPRFGAGTRHTEESALKKDLDCLRTAIEHYAVEHLGSYPRNEAHLLQYSDADGHISTVPDTLHIFGPYIHQIPSLPVGRHKGRSGVGVADGPDIGWIVDWPNGQIRANTLSGEKDQNGKAYSDY